MISAPKTPQPAADVGNVQPAKVASNQRAVPLPYFAGRRWLALTWAQSRVYRPQTKAVTQKVGKTKQVTGYDYYGDLFGLTSCCLVDYLEAIEVNGQIVWSGTIERDLDHPHHTGDIVVPGVGTFRHYWGTPDQPLDDLVLATCGEDHPRYLDQSYLVAADVFFGNNNATPPTIRVLVERAARYDGLPEDRTREGANPVTALAEVLASDWFGLARPELVDLATWAPLAAAIRRDTPVAVPGDPDHVAAMGYISPHVDRIQAVQAYLARVLEHFDGWLRRQDDLLAIGRFPHDGAIPGDLPTLTYHDFIEAPAFEAADDTDADLITDAVVTHLERDNNLEEDSQPATNHAARARLGEIREKQFARPYLVTGYQAREQAHALAKFYSRPELRCTVPIRRERLPTLRAGDRFKLADAPSSTLLVVRIVERRDDSVAGRTTLTLVQERGLAPLGYVPVPQAQPTLPDPDLVAIAHARIFQLPSGFADYAPTPTVVALAQRPAAHTAGFTVHFSTAGATYDQIATVGRWALRATLVGAITAADATFTIAAAGFDLALLTPQSDAARDDDTLLLVCAYEILSIGAVVALGGGQYQIPALRGRRGSIAAAHADTAECYIIPRASLETLQHADFPRATANRYFKLATYTTDEEQDLADALALALLFDDTTVEPPDTFAATAKAEAIFLSWEYPAPPDDLTIIATDLWERAAPVAPDPLIDPPDWTLRATGFNRGGLAAGTTKYYYALNRDRIGTRSALVGPINATALAAATGPQGIPGPGLVYAGDYNAGATYYHTTSRRDIVKSAGAYYLANNPAKSGTATWGAPGGADWSAPDATYRFVATALLLAEDATITKTLVMGDGATASGGLIRSAGAIAFATGPGFWMNPRNAGAKTEFRVGDPAAAYLSFDGTNLVARVGGTGPKLQLDIDPDFVGPNPPARLLFGSLKATTTAAGVTTLALTDGGLSHTHGTKFFIGNFVFGLGNNYGLSTTDGQARVKYLRSESGLDDWNGNRVVATRQAAVAAAPTDAPSNANESMNPADWLGTDTISSATLNAHLNAVDAFINTLGTKINTVAARLNDLRDRLKTTGGHGLIAD